MLMSERHQRIVEILLEQETATVAELSERFDVSPVTIRSDLNQLAEHGRVIRTHGGARIAKERVRQEITFAKRQRINIEQKRSIGEHAVTLIRPNESILLDASTTAVAVGQAIKRRPDLKDITVVTTGIWTALELLGSPDINVVLTGGHVRTTTGSITGSITNQVLETFNFQKVFLGAWGITVEDGLTDTHLTEVELKRAIISRAREVIAVLDGSKFGQLGLATFATLDEVTCIITDTTAPEEMVAGVRDSGVEVQIAGQDTGE